MGKKIIPYQDGSFTEFSIYGYNQLDEQTKLKVIEVESDEQLAEKEGHSVVAYYDEVENRVKYKYEVRPLTTEEELQKVKHAQVEQDQLLMDIVLGRV